MRGGLILRTSLWLTLIIISMGTTAMADIRELFLSPLVGTVSSTDALGETFGSFNFAYGIESGARMLDHVGVAVKWIHYSPGSSGTPALNVSQNDDDLTLDGRFLFFDAGLSPYVVVGAGANVRQVIISVMGENTSASEATFLGEGGAGLSGPILGALYGDLSVRYQQFANDSGIQCWLAVGVRFN